MNELSKQVVTAEDQQEYATSIYGIEEAFPYTLCITDMLLHGIDVPMVYHDNSLLRDVLDYTEEDQFDVILMNPLTADMKKQRSRITFLQILQVVKLPTSSCP